MATRLAILATVRAIRRVLAEASAGTEFAGAAFKIIQAAELAEATPPVVDGITLCLYQITANTSLRNAPARPGLAGGRTRPPLPLDLHFLLTAWSASAETQLSLLGWAMRVLDDRPVLAANVLNADFPSHAVFRADESVELTFDPLALPELAALWEGIPAARALPAITYAARLVAIDSEAASAGAAAEPARTWYTTKPPG